MLDGLIGSVTYKIINSSVKLINNTFVITSISMESNKCSIIIMKLYKWYSDLNPQKINSSKIKDILLSINKLPIFMALFMPGSYWLLKDSLWWRKSSSKVSLVSVQEYSVKGNMFSLSVWVRKSEPLESKSFVPDVKRCTCQKRNVTMLMALISVAHFLTFF